MVLSQPNSSEWTQLLLCDGVPLRLGRKTCEVKLSISALKESGKEAVTPQGHKRKEKQLMQKERGNQRTASRRRSQGAAWAVSADVLRGAVQVYPTAGVLQGHLCSLGLN